MNRPSPPGDGGPDRDLLAADVMAVQASRYVVPHLTVIGHSYGSTTTGTALRDHVTGVDDAVLVGSPGANVEHASRLPLDEVEQQPDLRSVARKRVPD